MREPLSTADKKAARIVINLALQRDYNKTLEEYYELLTKWKAEKTTDSQATYLSLYKAIEENDQYISTRYDGLSGSRYFNTIVGLLIDEILSEKDLKDFSPSLREDLLRTAFWLKNS